MEKKENKLGDSVVKKDWTVMVYLAGDNNLAEEMVFALKSLYSVGSSKNVQVVALYDTNGAMVPFDIPVRRASEVTADHDLKQGEESFLKFKEQVSKASKKSEPITTEQKEFLRRLERLHLTGSVNAILQGFIADTIARFEASHYALILSGHGSGAVGDFLTSAKHFFSLTIPGLGRVLRGVKAQFQKTETGKLDILGFDSCLMSMAEVAYEVKDCVSYMVGAEGSEANTGWPYDRILRLLHHNPNPRDFAKKIVDEYIKCYTDYTVADLSVDLSALDLGRLDKLVDALGKNPEDRGNHKEPPLSQVMKDGLASPRFPDDVKDAVKDAIVLAHWEAQGYKNEQYVDLWDFCDRLQRRTNKIGGKLGSEIRNACIRVKNAIQPDRGQDQGLAFRSGYRGAAFQHSHGVSVFFPWAKLTDAAGISDLEHYSLLDFANHTRWDEFLSAYVDKTIGPPRRGENDKLRHSFLNHRPFLYTGKPGKEPQANFREPQANFREPQANFREPQANFRGSSLGEALKIASMKNPPINWYEQYEQYGEYLRAAAKSD